jgi:hypothetical protein
MRTKKKFDLINFFSFVSMFGEKKERVEKKEPERNLISADFSFLIPCLTQRTKKSTLKQKKKRNKNF